MRRISSRATFFQKRIFPVIWFGAIAIIVVIGLIETIMTHQIRPLVFLLFLPFVLLMAGIGYLFMKQLAFDLMDEVFEDDNDLIIRNQGKETRISLSSIMNARSTI